MRERRQQLTSDVPSIAANATEARRIVSRCGVLQRRANRDGRMDCRRHLARIQGYATLTRFTIVTPSGRIASWTACLRK
ncbi:hypothetical protein Poly24_26800 [Rosistilla carotiformis]|uniref:Uncharacterized protein n=1 Tax=Rosistilla carotiformis TaxID=2528017 RepID=A0A518JTT5_9BACT|nr:hypothetical protein Poly24_26800 [Rosistilla carotiformis]